MKKLILISLLFLSQNGFSECYTAKEYSNKQGITFDDCCFEIMIDSNLIVVDNSKFLKIVKFEKTFFDKDFKYTFTDLKVIDSNNKVFDVTIALHDTKPSKIIFESGGENKIYVITKK
jgi:hypothetical protein